MGNTESSNNRFYTHEELMNTDMSCFDYLFKENKKNPPFWTQSVQTNKIIMPKGWDDFLREFPDYDPDIIPLKRIDIC